MATESAETVRYYLVRCTTLREKGGLSKNALATKARIDRGTLSKIENSHPVTGAIVGRVFNALNEIHEKKLRYDEEVAQSVSSGKKRKKSLRRKRNSSRK